MMRDGDMRAITRVCESIYVFAPQNCSSSSSASMVEHRAGEELPRVLARQLEPSGRAEAVTRHTDRQARKDGIPVLVPDRFGCVLAAFSPCRGEDAGRGASGG